MDLVNFFLAILLFSYSFPSMVGVVVAASTHAMHAMAVVVDVVVVVDLGDVVPHHQTVHHAKPRW
jgi:hypothetical protein